MTMKTECISETRRMMRYHLARMWSNRHKPLVRGSVRDNLRGQRALRDHEAHSTGHTLVIVDAGSWEISNPSTTRSEA